MGPKYDPQIDFAEVYNTCKSFILNDDDLFKIRNGLDNEIGLGLSRDGHDRTSIPCYLSYVQDLPTGRERGRFLALEILPTNCRIMLVKFSSEKDVYMSSKCIIMPYTIAAGKGNELFNFLAQHIAIFVKEKKVEKDNLPMGIAFAFPLNKLALDVGILLSWPKGFGAQGAVGKDVVQLLREALVRYPEVSVNIMGIINVGTGTLLSLCWTLPDTKLGLIVGTITNACYVEQSSNCEIFDEVNDTKKDIMIINTDWARFGENGHLDFIRNEFDKILDSESSSPGSRLYEKCVATLFTGELVRLIVLRLMKSGAIFVDQKRDYIGIQWKMEMKSLIAIESDPPGVYVKAQEVMDKFQIRNCKEKDLAAFRFICETVMTRSAQLVGCGLASILNRMKYSKVSIAVDGGLYRLHPTYPDKLIYYTRLLTEPEYKFDIVVAEDSCGVGAAIMAGQSYVNVHNRSGSKLFEMDI
ncbi:hexokinase type 1 [Drosophila tropicalis]|uniref:hexokinase type 1 n=1 Tax=Drosophila tropicalis TaxID=46794 RepID=UPI0035ABB537